MTSDSITGEARLSSICFRSQEQLTGDDETLPDGITESSMEMSKKSPGELGVVVENIIEVPSMEGVSRT